MNDPIVRSFAAQLAELKQFVASHWAWPTPEAGFASYVFYAAGEQGPVPEIATASWPDASVIRHAPMLAVYGYWLALMADASRQHHAHWAHALEHLTVKDPFPLDRQSFTFRPMDLFGIAIGVTRCDAVDREIRLQLTQIISRLGAEGNKDPWSICLYGLAAYVLGVHWNKPVVQSFDGMPVHVLALMKWMTIAYSSSPNSTAIGHHVDDLDRTFLERCGLSRLETDDIGRAALEYFALRRTASERIQSTLRDTWPANRETQDAAIIVEQLCRRFPLFARQLQHRRRDVPVSGKQGRGRRPTIEMRDEYDVQDSLHALLKLHFDDVRPEEWTPSYGGSQSRMDFLLKREKIVVETKFMGPNLSQREVANQLTIDKDYYREHPDCQILICFVYDPEYRCTNPAALERDIGMGGESFRVRVVVGPTGT